MVTWNAGAVDISGREDFCGQKFYNLGKGSSISGGKKQMDGTWPFLSLYSHTFHALHLSLQHDL